MRLTITINMENDAFAESEAFEAARILKEYANKIEQTGFTERAKPLHDINGNTVGKARLSA